MFVQSDIQSAPISRFMRFMRNAAILAIAILSCIYIQGKTGSEYEQKEHTTVLWWVLFMSVILGFCNMAFIALGEFMDCNSWNHFRARRRINRLMRNVHVTPYASQSGLMETKLKQLGHEIACIQTEDHKKHIAHAKKKRFEQVLKDAKLLGLVDENRTFDRYFPEVTIKYVHPKAA